MKDSIVKALFSTIIISIIMGCGDYQNSNTSSIDPSKNILNVKAYEKIQCY
ncbi:MAG: hypothetical protein ABIA04_00095 [Pseudomonadota bacterium]